MDPSETCVLATYANSGASPLRSFTLQAAVPKTMSLSLEPASGADVPGAGSGGAPTTQRLRVKNAQHGVKPLAMRLRMQWTDAASGAVVVEQATVSFPPGM
jgi:AP-1 complex subunit gamma-1